MSHQEYMGIPRLIKQITDIREALLGLIRHIKSKVAISTIAILTVSTNVFASDVVILECGEFNFGPGINIRAANTSLRTVPPYLADGSPCAVAIANLLGKGFKIQDSSITNAPTFQANDVIHTYNLIKE